MSKKNVHTLRLENYRREENKKPPLGLTPKFVRKQERMNEIRDALARYYESQMKIPLEWIREYNELIDEGVL